MSFRGVRSVKHVEQKAFDGGVSHRGFPGCGDCSSPRGQGMPLREAALQLLGDADLCAARCAPEYLDFPAQYLLGRDSEVLRKRPPGRGGWRAKLAPRVASLTASTFRTSASPRAKTAAYFPAQYLLQKLESSQRRHFWIFLNAI